jgi:hypothetical protein
MGGGTHSLAREGLGESQFRRGDIHCGTLYIYVLCGLGALLTNSSIMGGGLLEITVNVIVFVKNMDNKCMNSQCVFVCVVCLCQKKLLSVHGLPR